MNLEDRQLEYPYISIPGGFIFLIRPTCVILNIPPTFKTYKHEDNINDDEISDVRK